MANTKDQVLEKPCIDYKCSFTHADFETVKLEQVYADGSKRTAKVPIFDGKFGMEGLLHVEDKFRKACNKLSYDTGRELFNGFEEVLADTAEDKWDNLVSGIPNNMRTVDRFNLEVQNFYLRYCDGEARNVMFKYLRQITKPMSQEVSDHSDHMEVLVRYANRLPGTEPQLNDDQIKSIIYDSFPTQWRQAYIRSGNNVATQTLAEVIQYMKNEKVFADADLNKKRTHSGDLSNKSKKPAVDSQRIRGGGGRFISQGRGRGGRQSQRNGFRNPCKYHDRLCIKVLNLRFIEFSSLRVRVLYSYS